MSDIDRAEHLAWCKARALEALDRGDIGGALASMASDMRKHPETDTPAVTMLLGVIGMQHAMNGDVHGMRNLIEGFN